MLYCDCFCLLFGVVCLFFFFKQKTAYEMRISDWSSDVCSSDLIDSRDFLDAKLRAKAAALLPDGTRIAFTGGSDMGDHNAIWEIGRASCRERVCQYV